MVKTKRRAQVGVFCVGCGTCIAECPLKAISINTGVKAEIDSNKCVGCGKCSKICPASTIEIVTVEVEHENEGQ